MSDRIINTQLESRPAPFPDDLAALLDIAELADSLVRDLRKHRYLSRENAATVADAFAGALRRWETAK